jgi:hypothetical protein
MRKTIKIEDIKVFLENCKTIDNSTTTYSGYCEQIKLELAKFEGFIEGEQR